MRYSELMLLEENVVDYLVECYINDDPIDPVEEAGYYDQPNIERDVDKMFKNKEKRYIHSDVVSKSEGDIRSSSDKVTDDKKEYQLSKLMNKLSGTITGVGAGTALIGKLGDSKLGTALGTAVAISGIISRIRFSKRHIQKERRRYESDLNSLSEKLDKMKEDLKKADDETYKVQGKMGVDKAKTEKILSKKEAYSQIEAIQRNINKVKASLMEDEANEQEKDNATKDKVAQNA